MSRYVSLSDQYRDKDEYLGRHLYHIPDSIDLMIWDNWMQKSLFLKNRDHEK